MFYFLSYFMFIRVIKCEYSSYSDDFSDLESSLIEPSHDHDEIMRKKFEHFFKTMDDLENFD